MKGVFYFLLLLIGIPVAASDGDSSFAHISALMKHDKTSTRSLERKFHKEQSLPKSEKLKIAQLLAGQSKNDLIKSPGYYAIYVLENQKDSLTISLERQLRAVAGLAAFEAAKLKDANQHLSRYSLLSKNQPWDNERLFYIHQLAWVKMGLDRPDEAFATLESISIAFEKASPLQNQMVQDMGRFIVADSFKKNRHSEFDFRQIPSHFRKQFVKGIFKELRRLKKTAKITPVTLKLIPLPEYSEASFLSLKEEGAKSCEVIPFIQPISNPELRKYALSETATCVESFKQKKSVPFTKDTLKNVMQSFNLQGEERSLAVVAFRKIGKLGWSCDQSAKGLLELDYNISLAPAKTFLNELNLNCSIDQRMRVHEELVSNTQFTNSQLAAEWVSLTKTPEEKDFLLNKLTLHRDHPLFQATALEEVERLVNKRDFQKAHLLISSIYPLNRKLNPNVWKSWARLALLAPNSLNLDQRLVAESFLKIDTSLIPVTPFMELCLHIQQPELIEMNWNLISKSVSLSTESGKIFLNWSLTLPESRMKLLTRQEGEVSDLINDVFRKLNINEEIDSEKLKQLPKDIQKTFMLLNQSSTFEKYLNTTSTEVIPLIEQYIKIFERIERTPLRPVFKSKFIVYTERVTKELQNRLDADATVNEEEKQQIGTELKNWRIL